MSKKKNEKKCEICKKKYLWKIVVHYINGKKTCEHDGEIKEGLRNNHIPLTKV